MVRRLHYVFKNGQNCVCRCLSDGLIIVLLTLQGRTDRVMINIHHILVYDMLIQCFRSIFFHKIIHYFRLQLLRVNLKAQFYITYIISMIHAKIELFGLSHWGICTSVSNQCRQVNRNNIHSDAINQNVDAVPLRFVFQS